MNKGIKYTTFISLGLLISFFIPWITVFIPIVGPFNANGFQLPPMLSEAHLIDKLFDREFESFPIGDTLYLIPLCCSLSMIRDFTGVKFAPIVSEFLIGLLLCGVLYFCIRQTNAKEVVELGIGFYLTAGLSFLGLITSFVQPSLKIADGNKLSTISDSTEVDKGTLLSRLAQLQDLKEKSVIDADLYEQERQTILAQLKELSFNKIENEAKNISYPSTGAEAAEYDNSLATVVNDDTKEYAEYPEVPKRSGGRILLIIISLVIIGGGFAWYYYSYNNSNRSSFNASGVNIDGKMYSARLLRKIKDKNVIDTFTEDKLDKSVAIEIKDNNSIALIKEYDDGNTTTNDDEGGGNEYRQSYFSTQNLQTKIGKLFWTVNSSAGGSGSGTTVYLIQSNNDTLTCGSIFTYSAEISTCLYSKKKNEILLLDAIWAKGESHFDAHRYNIIKYNFDGGTTKKGLGTTSFKYGAEENNQTGLEILQEILKKESGFSSRIDSSDYILR